MRRLLLAAALACAAFAPASAAPASASAVHACDLMVYLGDEVPYVLRVVVSNLPPAAQQQYQHEVTVVCSL